jgi:transcriptional regulator with XRE-family HTH domain
MRDTDNQRSEWSREVGRRIRRAREARGLSQDQLGSLLSERPRSKGAPQKGLVSHWEGGRREISAWDLVHISRLLHVSLDHLLGHLPVAEGRISAVARIFGFEEGELPAQRPFRPRRDKTVPPPAHGTPAPAPPRRPSERPTRKP